MSTSRILSPLDRLLDSAQNALSTVAGSPRAERANPGDSTPDVVLDDAEVAAAEALLGRSMRVTAMIQDGELQLMDADRSVSLRPRIRMQDGVATPD